MKTPVEIREELRGEIFNDFAEEISKIWGNVCSKDSAAIVFDLKLKNNILFQLTRIADELENKK